MTDDKQELLDQLSGFTALLPDLMVHIEQGFETACRFRFSRFGIEHLLYAVMDHPVMAGLIESVGGDPAAVKLSLRDAFKEHAALNGDTGRDPEICESLIGLSARISKYAEDYPGIEHSELVREAMIGLVEAVDGSMIAESALLDSGASSLLSDTRETGFFESQFDYLDFPGELFRENEKSVEPSGRSPRKVSEWLEDPDALGSGTLKDLFISKQTENKEVSGSGRKADPAPTASRARPSSPNQKPDEVADAVNSALRDLGKDAGLGRIDPVLGRDREIETVLSILRRRRKGSVLMHGEAGVGKTAIAEGVALRLRGSDIEPALAKRPYYELSMSDMVAGTKFRGDFEARMKHLIERLSAERAIVFIDEFHMLVGSGSTYGRGMDGANLLKPALARGEVTVIGATTTSEMRQFRQDVALMRRFEPLPILEQTRSETEEIMRRACWPYLEHHGLEIEEGVIQEICRITDLYQPERRFPDKAFDLLDASCVKAIETAGKKKVDDARPVLNEDHVRMAADRMGLRRPGRPDPELAARLSGLRSSLREDVIGQDAAVDALAEAATIAALNLDTSGVRGSFLVTGPQGSGKGMMPRAFAQHMGLPFIRIDMQTCQDHNGQAHLAGMPGPAGMEKPGLLVEAGDAHRDMVILLDEIDKAASPAHDLVASILKAGTFRSADGRMISLRGAWIFMSTSSTSAGGLTPGFAPRTEEADDRTAQSLPAGILDGVRSRLQLKALDQADLTEIVRQSLDMLIAKSRDFGVDMIIGEEVAARLAERCRNGKEAAEIVNARVGAVFARALVETPAGSSFELVYPEDGDGPMVRANPAPGA